MDAPLFEGLQDYGKAEEPAYLRRQKRVEVPPSRFHGSTAGRAGKVFLGVLLLGGAAYAVWSAVSFGRNDPRFHVASLHLRGGKFVPQSQLEEKVFSDRGRSILQVPLDQRRTEIEQIPWVRSATVTRVLPNQLWITVEERVPVAFLWTSEGVSLVDEEGVILDYPPGASFTFPVVRGISAPDPPAERRSKMQLFRALMRDLDRGDSRLREEISEVDLADSQDARVVIADSSGAVLLHLGKENFLARYLIYAGHVSQWKQKFVNIQSVDLRYDGQVVINADPQQKPLLPQASHPSPAGPSRPASQPGPRASGGLGRRLPSP